MAHRGILIAAAGAMGCTHRVAPVPFAAERWVASWEGPPQLTEAQNMPPAPGIADRSVRQLIHVSLGGTRWRFRISNEFGDAPLTIESAAVALSLGRDTIDPRSDVALRFGGGASVTVAPGTAVVSDPASIDVRSLGNVAITLTLGAVPRALTGHPGSRTTSFVAAKGATGATLDGATTVDHWYLISGAEVVRGPLDASVVVLGNSIADGRGSGTNKNNRWPDNLARRLEMLASPARIGVVNAGIGGNAVVRGGLGPTALARLQRDVLDQAGARWVIVSDGVNDIGGAHGPDSSASTARQLIDAYRQIIRRGHERGMRVYGATIPPFAGSQYGSPDHEAARQTVNRWIRDGREFDAVIDFDAALRDPADPTRLLRDADSGDHLHPNERGYVLMAEAVDLKLFSP